MLKVEWNKSHTWKVLKEIKNGLVVAMKLNGTWYYPRHDYSGYDYIDGNRYIASDCCHNCILKDECEANNPIWNACNECGIVQCSWF